MARQSVFSDDEILHELRKLGFEEIPDILFNHLKEELENYTSSELTPFASSASPHSNSSSIPSSSANGTSSHSDKTCSMQSHQSAMEYNISDKENYSSQRCFSANSGVIKRKTLRHVNGQPVITEDLRIIPLKTKPDWDNDISISKSCKQESLFENLNKRTSSSDTTSSSKHLSQSSTNIPSTCLIAKVPTKKFERSAMSKRKGVLLPRPNTSFNKKHDPVARYHEYRRFWDTLKNPGEDKRNHIRWAIRDKLLDYDFL